MFEAELGILFLGIATTFFALAFKIIYEAVSK